MKIQSTMQLFQKFCKLIAKERNKNVEVVFKDEARGFVFESEYNFLRNFSFSVNQNSALQLDLTFLSISDKLNIVNDYNDTLLPKIDKYKDLPFDKNNRLMPYWDFSLLKNSKHIPDILSFDFSFQQDLTPKYGLVDSSSKKPLMCKKVVFGLPKISFNLSKLMYLKNQYEFLGDEMIEERMLTIDQLKSNSFSICFRGGRYINLEGVILQSLVPRIGQMNQASIYEQNYYVSGYISFGQNGKDYPETKEQILIINGKQSKNERLTLYATQIPMLENSVSIYEKLDQIQKIIG